MSINLVQKYNTPGPRYTSYPTVPYWDPQSFTPDGYLKTLKNQFDQKNAKEGISLYIHLPFCESLCTFCACHKRITKKHSVEEPYIEALLQEWGMYLRFLEDKPRIKEIHLGGGTPTFFKVDNLVWLLSEILASSELCEEPEFSFEGHPNNTTSEHLQALYDLGFRRVSYGVQDHSEVVQRAINRIQPYENVKSLTEKARHIGYTSVGHDLVFGLPFQDWDCMEKTIRATLALKPDRLAFYSYAHVPWIKGVGQRGFDERDLPSPEEKRRLYEDGKALLEDLGYFEIGMDHFALPQDSLYQAMLGGRLHRNFMGYTTTHTQLMIGLGISSISDTWSGFAQNIKKLEDYYACLQKNEFPIQRGHLLTSEDLVIRQHILNLMCRLETSWVDPCLQFEGLDQAIERIQEMQSDGLLELTAEGIHVTEKGRPFVRNICMAFDLRMLRDKPQTRIFSMTI